MTPEEHRNLAFEKYSLECVARGIPEDTEAHTRCVLQKYESYNNEQQRAQARMQELYEKQETDDKLVSDAVKN